MIKLKLISDEKSKGRLTFIMEGAEPWFANTMRRLMASEVPVLAIEEIEFRKNDSALYDEMVALRLGLVPLNTELKSLNLKQDCTCGGAGCSLCQVSVTLKEKGPKMVYAKHLKIKDPKAQPVYPEMPIVKLDKGQELEFEAKAVLGKGIVHAKWSPGLVYFRQLPEIKIHHCDKDCKQCAESCPLGILECKQGKLSVNEKKLHTCTLCEACVEACPGCITLEQNPSSHVFIIESWGQLSCKEIAEKAGDIFESKLNELSKLIAK